eukprot:3842169-Pyramimonas_sp.AAC.1
MLPLTEIIAISRGCPERNRRMLSLEGYWHTAERMIDGDLKRSKTGAIHIFYVGRDHICWQSENGTFKSDPYGTTLLHCCGRA